MRIRVLLAVLLVGSGLAIWSWFGIFENPITDGTASILNASQGTPTATDTDGDGLADTDETFWKTDFKNPDTDGDSYSDGEEVMSGHNPVKAGPNDLLDERANLTEKSAELLLGGVLSGDLDPNSQAYQSALTSYTSSIISELSKENVDPGTMLASSDSDRDVTAYAFHMATVLDGLTASISQGFNDVLVTLRGTTLAEMGTLATTKPGVASAFVSAAQREANTYSSHIKRVQAIRVPPALKQFHRDLLVYLRTTQQQYRNTTTLAKDPARTILTLHVLRELTDTTLLGLITEFSQQLSPLMVKQIQKGSQ